MKKNIGSCDRTFRIIAGVAGIAAGVYFGSWWGALGLVPLITAFIGWCPAYTLFGISTCGSSCSSKSCSTSCN